jgi:phosphatidate cytidylyltransferase
MVSVGLNVETSLMSSLTPTHALFAITIALSALLLIRAFVRRGAALCGYFGLTWAFFVAFLIADLVSFRAGTWVIAILSFVALREYFSLIDIRLQDRLGILGAYASIPFMFHFVTTGWYGMFIISIPVYSFLAIPLLVTLGGRETDGTIFSIGAIDFGLFLFVYCMGHIGYLMSYQIWMAAMLILNVAVCDWIARAIIRRRHPVWKSALMQFAFPLPVTACVTILLSPWTTIPVWHSLVIGAMIPLLVLMGRRAGDYVEADLGVKAGALSLGRGQILDNLKSLLFAAPVVFHYIRYFLT